MRTPSIERLMALFPKDIDRTRAKIIKKLAHLHTGGRNARELLELVVRDNCPRTISWADTCLGNPFHNGLWRTTMTLSAIDELCGTCGVESFGPTDSCYAPAYEYLNTGDLYTRTLVYKRATDNLYIASPGDIMEKMNDG